MLYIIQTCLQGPGLAPAGKSEFCCRLNKLIRVQWPVGCTVDLGTSYAFVSGGIYVAGEKPFPPREGTSGECT